MRRARPAASRTRTGTRRFSADRPERQLPDLRHVPGGLPGGGGYDTYGAPFVSTLIVQYKHGPLAITPALQFSGGTRYGVRSRTGDSPRQLHRRARESDRRRSPLQVRRGRGAPYDATACTQNLSIPDIFTNQFDGSGLRRSKRDPAAHADHVRREQAFDAGGQLRKHPQPLLGGTKVPFAVNQACGYTTPTIEGGGNNNIGNAYNPAGRLQPQVADPYFPTFPSFPFNMYFEARLKI